LSFAFTVEKTGMCLLLQISFFILFAISLNSTKEFSLLFDKRQFKVSINTISKSETSKIASIQKTCRIFKFHFSKNEIFFVSHFKVSFNIFLAVQSSETNKTLSHLLEYSLARLAIKNVL
jgi:hypothetical protein